MLKVDCLRTEYLKNPIGINAKHPRLSWKLYCDAQNAEQESYRILAASDPGFEHIIWDSKIIKSDASLGIRYEGEGLKSRERVYWNVTVSVLGESATSDTAYFEMGLLKEEDWEAHWIEPNQEKLDIEAYNPACYLRRKFKVKRALKSARIYQTAHGLYEFWMNGKRGTEDIFKPGFTSYYHRIQYQAYDITELLEEGENIWSVILGDGWWRGNTGGMYRNNFGYKLQFLGQIILEYADGAVEVIGTDEQFKTAQGGLLMNDMKFGEVYDARLEPEDWRMTGFDDLAWSNVQLSKGKYLEHRLLIPSLSIPVREKERFTPEILIDKEGNTVLDFGQNIAGYVHMRLKNTQPGQRISLVHSEDMKDGVFYLGNVCTELTDNTHYQQLDYIAKGKKVEIYQPQFSVFGFRYVKLEGYTEHIESEDFTAIAVYSDMDETGDFSCSNDLLNQLVKNSRWSQKGNFLDVPTDCPTRERSPWTGDAQVYAKTASQFMNVYPFFEKWMKDVSAEQYRNGMVANSVPATTSLHSEEEVTRLIMENKCGFIIPGIAGPDGRPGDFDGSAGWGDVAVILPYTMYLCYGDTQILENQYETAKRWVNYMIDCAKEENENKLDSPEYHTYENGIRDADYIFDTRFHFGEWLEPYSEESGNPAEQDLESQKKRTDSLVATAYLFYSATLLAKMAEILGKTKDREYYILYSKDVKRVYNKYFIQADGTIIPGKQAPYVRVLQFGLCSTDIKDKVAGKLAEEVRNNDMCLNTGFLSTPFLLFQLLENGYKEEAFAVLEQTKTPSWLHPVLLGATTILEDWTGLDEHMNSYNHYSYGAVCDFLFGAVCGIQPIIESAGYKYFRIKPVPGGTLTHANAVLESPYGTIRSNWKKNGGATEFCFEIPVNTRAQIILPDETVREVGSGIYRYTLTDV